MDDPPQIGMTLHPLRGLYGRIRVQYSRLEHRLATFRFFISRWLFTLAGTIFPAEVVDVSLESISPEEETDNVRSMR